MDALLEALRQHPLSPQVQSNGCAAIGNLVFKHDQNQQALVDAEGPAASVLPSACNRGFNYMLVC